MIKVRFRDIEKKIQTSKSQWKPVISVAKCILPSNSVTFFAKKKLTAVSATTVLVYILLVMDSKKDEIYII